jgi:hemerythrin
MKGGGISMTIAWSSVYETGLREVDAQHRHLFVLMNNLARSLGDDATHGEAGKALRALECCTRDHLQWEEKLLLASGYEDVVEHLLAHQRLLKALYGIVSEFDAGRPINERAVAYFNHWFGKHPLLWLRSWEFH